MTITNSLSRGQRHTSAGWRIRDFLNGVIESGKLGSGKAEHGLHVNSIVAFFTTLPWEMLLTQLLWSSLLVAAAYHIGVEKYGRIQTFGNKFWASRLNVPPSITADAGWALFILLGFFIEEATKRNNEGTDAVLKSGHYIRFLIRNIALTCPPGSWHPGDVDRIIRHLIAYPIALKMQLRGEREREQLAPILHSSDVDDVVNANVMHVHCSRVVRAYMVAIDQGSQFVFRYSDADKTPFGPGNDYTVNGLLDTLDFTAQKAVALSQFRPSIAYINHLQIFMYIWMMFLPLTLIASSGWFTILWSVLITHAVGMLYNIASDLNDPFGFDIHDIKLNRICAKLSLEALDIYTINNINNEPLIDESHETPTWLDDAYETDTEQIVNPNNRNNFRPGHTVPIGQMSDVVQPHASNQTTLLSLLHFNSELRFQMIIYLAWCFFIAVYAWFMSGSSTAVDGVGWVSVYIPLNTSTVSYLSLSIFLVLGFWMSNSYNRYWSAIEIWSAKIPSIMNDALIYTLTAMRKGLWHQRDHERLLSFFAAFPIVAKQQLRGLNDFNDLAGILSEKDILRIQNERNPTEYVFEVINGYFLAADGRYNLKIDPTSIPCLFSMLKLKDTMQELQMQFYECTALQQIPIPPAFTSHLYLFTAFWLTLLPIILIIQDGLISFLFLIPMGYSIMNLIIIGKEMQDPFGTDAYDLPMDTFCYELKEIVKNAYTATRNGPSPFIKDTGYSREDFSPSFNPEYISLPIASGPTPLSSLRTILGHLPSVSACSVVACVLWAIVATISSRLLSYDGGKACSKWCSRIEVEGPVLANIGFALFLILGFRAADAITRYSSGGELLQTIRLRLRDLALDFVLYFDDCAFHEGDKERAVAHIVQIPLYFRDVMLGQSESSQVETMLNEEDYNRFINAPSPMEHLFQTLSSYIVIQDTSFRDSVMLNAGPGNAILVFASHIQTLRNLIAQARTVKRFPVIRSYINHQHVFTALWLALLPLAMTKHTGYYTILWAPLISYALLSLENLAVKLVDPFGTDDIDLPVGATCSRAASEVLDTVREMKWGERLAKPSPITSSPIVSTAINYGSITVQHKLINIDDALSLTENSSSYSTPPPAKPKPTLYAHFLQSVPWWTLFAVTAWTLAGCIISYLSRTDEKNARWGVSTISISADEGTYLSFLAFILLGFYVNKAFARYSSAGEVWDVSIRSGCHVATHYFMSMMPANSLHEGDHKRLVSYIAAVPFILKAELRDSRDIREASGILSHADLGAIQAASSMTRHCLDVILSYWYAFLKKEMSEKSLLEQSGSRTAMLRNELLRLENAINRAFFLKNFPIAPGFVSVLDCLLGLFFVLLPFIVAEVSGWFSIIWVPVVAYGVLGMYKVAGELQDPFGYDLNDLDLDSKADKISREVLFVYKQQKSGHTSLIQETQPVSFWLQKPHVQKMDQNVFKEYDSLSFVQKFAYGIKLAVAAVPFWMLATFTGWSALAVLVSYAVSKFYPQTGNNDGCLWFCSAIAIKSSIESYIGFSLFLLLGFFLLDSHWRYVFGLQQWREHMVAIVTNVANRLFQTYYANYWHPGDLQRIAGHLAASSIALKDDLQGTNDMQKLRVVLCNEDAERVSRSFDKVQYCLDVVRSYLMQSETVGKDAASVNPGGPVSIFFLSLNSWLIGGPFFNCRRIVSVPLPFGYVQHLRIFLLIWLFLLPLSVVQNTGWITVLWMGVIGYGLIGVERWAERLSDPFGEDLTDLPLADMSDDIIDVVKDNLLRFENSLDSFVIRNRKSIELLAEAPVDIVEYSVNDQV